MTYGSVRVTRRPADRRLSPMGGFVSETRCQAA